MNIAVVYKSKKCNKKLAIGIGKAINVEPQDISQFDDTKEYDVVFFGASIYGGSVAPDVFAKILTWKKENIKKVVLYSANGFGKNQYQLVIDTLRENGIEVEENVYTCLGQAFFFKNHGHPKAEEVDAAGKFAVEMLKDFK